MKRLLTSVLISLVMFTFFSSISLAIGGTNSQDSDTFHEFATVEDAPGAAGYGTNIVSVKAKVQGDTLPGVERIFFSVRAPAGTLGSMTITLQYMQKGDTAWSDYDTYTDYERLIIEGGSAETLWRAIVKNGAYSSGTATFGFNW